MHVQNYVELYLPEEVLRFTAPSEDAGERPGELDYVRTIPALEGLSITPTVLAPGESLGSREKVTITLRDCLYPFGGTAVETGTLWGKIRARYPSLRGRPLIVRRGEVGQDFSSMETRTYYVDSLGYNGSESVTLTAKDPLKLLDGDRSVAPFANTGRLAGAIDDNDTAFVLEPAGVGTAEYRTAGLATIGGNEIVEYTRSGDTVTLVQRALYFTEAVDHEADSSFQEVLEFNTGSGFEMNEDDFNDVGLLVPAGRTFDGGLPAEIVAYLMVKYAKVPPELIPLAEWYTETTGRTYRAPIAQPEGVRKLIDEMIQQGGLTVWYDVTAAQIRLRSLLSVSGVTPFNTSRIMEGTFSSKDQEDKRASQVWCYWGMRNPLRKLDERDNFRGAQVNLASTEYPGDFDEDDNQSIRTLFGRWTHTQANAEFVCRLMLARYADPPRQFQFGIYRADRGVQPALAQRCTVGHWSIQDEDGLEVPAGAQIVSLTPSDDASACVAEEIFVRSVDGLTDRVVYISLNAFNVNLRALHDEQYTTPQDGDSVTFVVESSVRVGSSSTSLPSVDVGTWPSGVTILLRLSSTSRIQGHGGNGGLTGDGEPGGTALYTRYALTVENNGKLWGGGGGGGGSATPLSGGGGAGYLPGVCPDDPPRDGTFDNGGGGLFGGGQGGGPGEAGGAGVPDGGTTSGGSSGAAVDGVSYVTFAVTGDTRGLQVN